MHEYFYRSNLNVYRIKALNALIDSDNSVSLTVQIRIDWTQSWYHIHSTALCNWKQLYQHVLEMQQKHFFLEGIFCCDILHWFRNSLIYNRLQKWTANVGTESSISSTLEPVCLVNWQVQHLIEIKSMCNYLFELK